MIRDRAAEATGTGTEVVEAVAALDWAKKSGRARFIGFSSHDRSHLKNLIETYPAQMEVILTPYTASTKVVTDETGLWASIQKQIHSPEFLGTVGRYLESVSLDGWNPRKIPESEEKKEMLELSKPAELLWLEDAVAEATAAGEVPPWKTINELYTDYKLWGAANGMSPLFMAQSANKLAIKIIPWKNTLITKTRRSNGVVYRITPTL